MIEFDSPATRPRASNKESSMSDKDQPQWVGSDFQQRPAAAGVVLCGACKRLGRCRLGLAHEQLDASGVMHANIICPADHEGGPEVAHGGWTAAMLDEVLGHASLLHGQMAVTATLKVDFLKPVPIERPLEARAWIDKREGSRIYISGEIVLASTGVVLARATGIWVARDYSHFDRHRQWLAEQDAGSSSQNPKSDADR
jgi:acyl-coenzyme A thioesterase PaaI-like protein